MGGVTWRAAAQHLPWLLVLSPLLATPLAMACERALRRREARLRSARLRRNLGEPRSALRASLSDSEQIVTLAGTLRATEPDACAMTWAPSPGRFGTVHQRTRGAWRLDMADARVDLTGAFEVQVGSEETASGTPLYRSLAWAGLWVEGKDDPEELSEGQARVIRAGERVRIRGRLVMEPSGTYTSESYRARRVRARLVPVGRALPIAAETVPHVALRPAMLRVARLTVALSVAFAVVPALTILFLQWRTMQDSIADQAQCQRDLGVALETHQPWQAADLAARCGSIEEEAEVAWHNAEMTSAARHHRRLREDRASDQLHASNVASQIAAGRFDEASRVVNRMSQHAARPQALHCLAAGLWLMHGPSAWAEGELRDGAIHEQQQLRSITDDTPITCTPLLAELVGDTSVLEHEVSQIHEHGASPGYLNSYLAALLIAEKRGGLAEPLLQRMIDARHPPSAISEPSSWALEHPVALSTALLRSAAISDRAPPEQRRVLSALAAQKALFDAYMGERELAIASLARLREIVEAPRHRREIELSTHIFVIGAAAAILARDLGTAASLMDYVGDGDDARHAPLFARLLLRAGEGDAAAFTALADGERGLQSGVLWRAAADGDGAIAPVLAASPLSAVHGFLPYATQLSKREPAVSTWLHESFPPLCHTCGLRALAEHLASRRVAAIALDDPIALRLAEPARHVHATMTRRDIALPLYLLERISNRATRPR